MTRQPFEQPLRLSEPLTVDIVDSEILLNGGLPVMVSLTPFAAIRTGIALIDAASKLVDDKAFVTRPSKDYD